jgi:SAM-dependent methyltransferase
MRHLPRPANGRRLLDVGCGSGEFLSYARSAGWRVTGFDLDPKAVESARLQGLDVHLGGIETLAGEVDAFDAITASHVIEHVYNPKGLLANCHRLLKPGGYFWIETPNIDSRGHKEFKEDWLDLDPPRHLTIHTWQSMRKLLAEAGFSEIHPLDWRPEYELRYHACAAIRRGEDPRLVRSTLAGRLIGRSVALQDRKDFTQWEFVTLTATKKIRGSA